MIFGKKVVVSEEPAPANMNFNGYGRVGYLVAHFKVKDPFKLFNFLSTGEDILSLKRKINVGSGDIGYKIDRFCEVRIDDRIILQARYEAAYAGGSMEIMKKDAISLVAQIEAIIGMLC